MPPKCPLALPFLGFIYTSRLNTDLWREHVKPCGMVECIMYSKDTLWHHKIQMKIFEEFFLTYFEVL